MLGGGGINIRFEVPKGSCPTLRHQCHSEEKLRTPPYASRTSKRHWPIWWSAISLFKCLCPRVVEAKLLCNQLCICWKVQPHRYHTNDPSIWWSGAFWLGLIHPGGPPLCKLGWSGPGPRRSRLSSSLTGNEMPSFTSLVASNWSCGLPHRRSWK